MNNRFKLGAALFAAAGTFAFAGAAPANAAACPSGSPSLGSLTAGFNCTLGGFTFTFNSFSGFSNLDTISFSNPGGTQFNYSIQKDITWVAGTKTLSYSQLFLSFFELSQLYRLKLEKVRKFVNIHDYFEF